MLIRLPTRPTAEQIVLITRTQPGVDVIRGAAGSGKTTTAILRLRQLASFFTTVKEQGPGAVRILVLAFNRSLAGYLEHACHQEVAEFGPAVDLTVDTFARWALSLAGRINWDIDETRLDQAAAEVAALSGLDLRFVENELRYVLGRFPPQDRALYLDCERTGRGARPRVDRGLRQTILEALQRAEAEKGAALWWEDIGPMIDRLPVGRPYDAIIIDEAQDLSGNTVRAILRHAADPRFVTLVLDSAQRIYPHRFSWAEVGLNRPGETRFTLLRANHRNTRAIAAFAAPLFNGVAPDEDAAVPAPWDTLRAGDLPTILRGRFGRQLEFALQFIRENVDLDRQTVAFLHPLGGRWFTYDSNSLLPVLVRAGLNPVIFQAEREWTSSSSNVGVGTLHSAKGLEFDYVFFLGLDAQTMEASAQDPQEDRAQEIRRLFAMAIGRAREAVFVGFRADATPDIFNLLDPSTYQVIDL